MGQNRIEYISLASLVSAMAVIFLHANGCFHIFSTGKYWISANVIEAVFYFAVPVFFMISGAMLIDYNERYDTRMFFLKRFNKTFVPFVIWSFIGLAFQIFFLHSVKASNVNLIYVANGLINGNLTNVFWFFIPLFCTYLAIPLFAAVPKDSNKKIFIYLAAVGFTLNILAPFIISVFGLKLNWKISLAASGGYLFYTLAGYLIHKWELKRKYRIMIYLFALLGLAMNLIGTYTLSIGAGHIVETFRGYVNLPCVVYSLGVFVFIKYDLVKIMRFGWISRIVNFLNPYTFGIYLLHWFVLEIIVKAFSIDTHSIVYRLIAPFAILVISVALIWIVQRIPGGKRVIP